MTVQLMDEKKREMAWKCPRCKRIFRHHVFDSTTPATGPMCNTCCVELEWVEVEAAAESPEAASSPRRR